MTLTPKSLAHILTFWTPGSGDDGWTWKDEYRDLIEKPETRYIHRQIADRGIGFADQTDPVLLGDDGRVWDGHHRIILAIEYGIHELMVAFGETKENETMDAISSEESESRYVEILPNDIRLGGTTLLVKIEEIFSSKEYSKKYYTREELHDLFRATRIKFENGQTTAMHFTNPLRSTKLKTKVVKDHLGQYQVNIEGRVISSFDSEPEAQEFIDHAQKDPMMWRD